MDSLDLLNLRAGECSFLETALADVRRYVAALVSEDKKRAVLVFPPLSARNRFLVHTLVRNFFNELNTISIGNSHGRRTVVYHSSLAPMICETEIEESNTMNHNEGDACVHRAYRTPSERKAQEKLFQSLMPKKKVDKSTRSTQRKQSKRPDIPIYVPKARRSLPNNTAPGISSTTNSLNITTPCTLDSISTIEDDSGDKFDSKELNDSPSPLNLDSQQKINVLTSLDSVQYENSKNEMLVDNIDIVPQISWKDTTSQISEPLSSSCTSDFKNTKEFSDSSVSGELLKTDNFTSGFSEEESNLERIISNNCDNDSTDPSLPVCLSNCTSDIFIKYSETPVNLSDLKMSVINNDITVDCVPLSLKISETNNEKVSNVPKMNHDEKITNTTVKEDHETCLGVKVVDSSILKLELETEYNSNCANCCLDDSLTSGTLTDKEENISNTINEELTIQQSSESVNKSLDIVENNEKKSTKKKKTKKKILDVDECSWEDLYDKEDDYIHPLLMKELISSMGKVQVNCAKGDYRSHQTIEERSGDGECVIEVYGFSSDLKTVDLMNQFAAFRKQKFEIVWVDDTHALAVFESPQLADRALNTPFALVKTRPLKNAIRESKLKAETVAPLPATRPKTCTAMARRLVSSALGLKVNVSPALLNAERTLLANAKEKKIRDAQQKHDIWNDS